MTSRQTWAAKKNHASVMALAVRQTYTPATTRATPERVVADMRASPIAWPASAVKQNVSEFVTGTAMETSVVASAAVKRIDPHWLIISGSCRYHRGYEGWEARRAGRKRKRKGDKVLMELQKKGGSRREAIPMTCYVIRSGGTARQ